MNSNIPPSPIPPWHRPVRSPLDEVFTEDNDGGTLSIERETTHLRTTTAKEDASPYAVTLPDGNYRGQSKTLFIPGDIIAESAQWKVTGSFANADSLILDQIGTSAFLRWDGSVWQVIGGNASSDE